MEKNLYHRPLSSGTFVVVWICCLLLISPGCMLFKKITGAKENKSFNKFAKQSAVSIDEEPKQLITYFSGHERK